MARVLSLPRMKRLYTLGLHHQKEDFRTVRFNTSCDLRFRDIAR